MKSLKTLAASVACALGCSNVSSATLNDAVLQAIESNPRLQASVEVYRENDAGKDSAKSGFFPRLDLNGDIGEQDIERRPDVGTDTETDLTRKLAILKFTLPLFRGFDTVSGYKQQDFLLQAAEDDAINTAQSVAYETVQAYYGVIKAHKILKLAEENLEVHTKMLKLIKTRVRQGVSDQSELAQVQGRYSRANASVIAARNNVQVANASLLAVAGQLESPYTDPGVALPGESVTLDQALQEAMNNHPQILAEQDRVEASRKSVTRAQSNYYPEVDFVADKTWEDDVDGFEGEEEDVKAVLEFRWNLYEGGATSSQKEQQQARLHGAQDQLENVIRLVKKEVETSYSEFQTLVQQRDELKNYAQYMKKTESLYQDQYKVNKRTLLDLLNSQNELFQSQQSLVGTEYDTLVAWYRLQAAQGKLLPYLNVAFSPEEEES